MRATFLAIWCAAAGYVVLMSLLGLRLGWLRRTNRAPTAPTAEEFVFSTYPWGPIAFVFSARHKEIGDPVASAMVAIYRVLLIAVTVLLVGSLIGFAVALALAHR